MRKIARISALVLCVACFLMLSPKSAAYAQQEFKIGDEVIYIDGEPYYLQGTSREAQPTSLDPGGPSSIKDQISYYYTEGTGRNLVVFAEVTRSVFVGDTEIATLLQTSEWHYVYGESVEFISGYTTCSYMHPSVARITIEDLGHVNGTYSAKYMVFAGPNIVNGTVSTTCSIYGTIS